MNRLKSFFAGILLLAIVFAMVFLTALIYRANERSSIRSYIFQMSNHANQRVGTLQNLNDISANDLRNKLIKVYVSEYFKVIPGDQNITDRPLLKILSDHRTDVFEKWESTVAKEIEEMSSRNMFRMVRIHDDGIVTYNKTDVGEEDAGKVYYMVRYYTSTWPDSNTLETEPIYDQGTLYLEIRFKPGIVEDEYITGIDKTGKKKHMSLREYLESGNNPAGLFKFRVTKVK